MQTLWSSHLAKNMSSEPEFVSNKTTKILKPPPRYYTQNIEDANIANTGNVKLFQGCNLHHAQNASSDTEFVSDSQ
jgi:hypothetical protein